MKQLSKRIGWGESSSSSKISTTHGGGAVDVLTKSHQQGASNQGDDLDKTTLLISPLDVHDVKGSSWHMAGPGRVCTRCVALE